MHDSTSPARTAPTPTRGEHVYEWVCDRIIDGTLPNGNRIRERELSEQLGVSRIPIREALPRLEAEGYIRTVPRRGAIVSPLALSQIVELFEVRASLEVLAARLAATRCAEGADGSALQETLDRAETALAAGDDAALAAATSQLHDEIVNLSQNELLMDLMVPVHGRIKRVFHLVSGGDDTELHREHRDLCVAILRGQVERAAAVARAHVEHSRAETLPIVAAQLHALGAGAPVAE